MLVSEEDWQAIQETLFLSSIPGMRKSIHDAMAEPLSRSARKPRLVSWLPVHSKQALKDAKKLEAAGLEPRAEELLDILKNDPLQNPPAFEKLAGANPRWLGAMGAFTLVLHTWTQDLRRHIHVHALMACGGLDADGRWCTPKRSPTFLFPVHALSSVFRGKFLDALRRASQAGELPLDPADTDPLRQARLKELTRHDWVWCMRRRRWPDPRWCRTICRATRTVWPSPTNVSSASTPRACACEFALTIAAASARR